MNAGKAVLVGMILSAVVTVPLAAQSGHTVWGAWTFDWEVVGGNGLALRNVSFNNKYMIYKANLPVIRVRYDHSCGPYADRIDWSNLVPISNCGDQKLCQKSYSSGGRNWLEVAVYARIGAYHLYQAWYLSHDGWIRAQLWSKGLQCDVDHDHHPYWRIDFDVAGAPSDQIFVYDNNRPDEGWGPGWHKHTNELNETKNPATNRRWVVRDHPGGQLAWVIPDAADGVADWFSTKDAASRRYQGAEDQPWPFGGGGHLGYDNGEDIQEKDVVYWYVCHLHHHAAEGGDQWHTCGPWLYLGG